MAIAVPFGQYVPGSSVVHTLDARMKLLILAAYVAALFLVAGAPGLLACTLLLLGGYLLARIPLKLALRGFKPILLILIFTFLANALTFTALPAASAPRETLDFVFVQLQVPQSIALIGTFGLRPGGVALGLYFAVRIMLLVSVTSLLTFTSSIVAITDAITSLMRPLRVLRVPVDDIAMMFTIALRFIPLTAEEAERLMAAQAARGARFDRGGPIKRARAYMPLMIPLFVGLFRRADELALAMESRCYTGAGRTHLRRNHMRPQDALTGLVATVALIVLGILL
jgi:energy-coupling factor transport system permease protein